MVEAIKLGVIGVNEGNGHPFSFSAIINGFNHEGMSNSGWDVIYNYLKIRDASEFGFDNVQVTHAWTQDPEQTERLAKASRRIEDKILRLAKAATGEVVPLRAKV